MKTVAELEMIERDVLNKLDHDLEWATISNKDLLEIVRELQQKKGPGRLKEDLPSRTSVCLPDDELVLTRDHAGFAVWEREPILYKVGENWSFVGAEGDEPFCTFLRDGDPDGELLPKHIFVKLRIGESARVRMAIRKVWKTTPKRHYPRPWK